MTDFVKADRLAKVKVSEIVVMSEAARQRRAEGHDVINLGIGEPDFVDEGRHLGVIHADAQHHG
ncbi:MAG: aspartate transaminase, partial [Candidatus Puniceispirillales bacterium]